MSDISEDSDLELEANCLEVRVPRSLKKAIESDQKEEWIKAMQEEMKMMDQQKVWELILKKDGKKNYLISACVL